MKNKYSLILIGFFLVLMLSFGYYLLNPSLERIPKGDLITQETSPDGTYTIKAYELAGGATMDFGVVGELVWNKTKDKKTVYWKYHQQKAKIKWLNHNTVVINGKKLKMPNDVYDYRDE